MTASSARAVSAEPRQAEEVVEDVADGGHGQGQVALAGEQVNWPDPAVGTMDHGAGDGRLSGTSSRLDLMARRAGRPRGHASQQAAGRR
jgi:hypothetical protein